jgi:hypothetical protein
MEERKTREEIVGELYRINSRTISAFPLTEEYRKSMPRLSQNDLISGRCALIYANGTPFMATMHFDGSSIAEASEISQKDISEILYMNLSWVTTLCPKSIEHIIAQITRTARKMMERDRKPKRFTSCVKYPEHADLPSMSCIPN